MHAPAKPRKQYKLATKMNLAGFAANVDFSQWSLSIEGIPVERKRQNGDGEAV